MLKYVVSVFLLYCSVAGADEYFVKLSPAGIELRDEILQNKNNNSFLGKTTQNSLLFREIRTVKHSPDILNNWLLLTADNAQFDLKDLENDQRIEFIEPVGVYTADFLSNDSLSSQQWYLDKINLAEAWQISKGSPDIIVAIIDTGVDYEHPDLIESVWINPVEDLNQNGIFDAQDINHIDDDQNGFVDDVAGWDFTDAPRFADGGDYQKPDNQPWDEFGAGHGTQIAGIIAAKDNNEVGIAGIAPQIKVMNLRAGTASGYLEEDDVAKAIIYAIENGARIINMSFGDIALSRFMKDVIQYAYEQNVLMVASAGNSASNETHFPSGLPQTISVGASTQNDGLAGFSNFGNTIDLVAPGFEMISTAVAGKYNSVNGTSFSAPVISAIAALMLSHNPDLSIEQIRNILKSSSNDILYSGWDDYSGAGRVSAAKALAVPYGGVLQINSPARNQSSAEEQISIIGSAAHPDLQSVSLLYGFGRSPEQWIPLKTLEKEQVLHDTIAVLDASELTDTTITLQLKIDLFNGLKDEIRSTFFIDRTAPVMSDMKIIPLWDGAQPSLLLTFISDDICTADIQIRPAGTTEVFDIINSPFETTNHRIKLDGILADGYEFRIRLKNYSGLAKTYDNDGQLFKTKFVRKFYRDDFKKINWSLPPGYMLDYSTDMDHDGKKEIVMSRYDENFAFGPVEIYEFNNGEFELATKTSLTAIPRAAGDVDLDGKSDLLLGFGQLTFLYEAKDESTFPSELIWQDTSDFWGAAYTDLDNDDLFEICGRIDTDYVLLENTADNSFFESGRLLNKTEGENRLGVPRITICDLNNDGLNDLFFGDYDGDVIGFSAAGNNDFEQIAAFKTQHFNATEMITSNGKDLLFSATHTSGDLNYEHEFDARYWTIEIFSQFMQDITANDTINTFGFRDTRDFDSGLSYRRFDDRSFLFAAFFPDLFIFENKDNKWQLVWHSDNVRSNTVLVEDFDKDGYDEFYFNTGSEIIGMTSGQGERPQAPLAFNAVTQDSSTIYLSWQNVENAQFYNVYRGDNKNNLQQIAKSVENNFTDSDLPAESKFYYTVTAVDSMLSNAESYFSTIDSAETGTAPNYLSMIFSGSRQVRLIFDSKLKLNNSNPAAVTRILNKLNASSVLLSDAQTALLVSYTDDFVDGLQDTFLLENIFGINGVPLNPQHVKIPYTYYAESIKPFVKQTDWLPGKRLYIQFSQSMNPVSLKTEENYVVEPAGTVQKIILIDSLHTKVELSFDHNTFSGSSGKASYLFLNNIISSQGVRLDETNVISLFNPVDALNNIIVYPQPVKPRHDQVMFSNLPNGELIVVSIYSVNGALLKRIKQETYYGGISWDLKDNAGKNIPSGVYLYDIHWNDKSKQGKIVIVR